MAGKPVSTRKFADAVAKFNKAGISRTFFLPIAPIEAKIADNAGIDPTQLGKVQGRYNERRGQWGGLRGSYVVEGVREEDWHEFKNWPTPNVGLMGRAYPAIDSDAESPAARRLVEAVTIDTFGEFGFAERIRGVNERRLYAFRARAPKNDPVRTRHFTFKLPGDVKPSKVDLIGSGNYYLITGTHPHGEEYEWAEGAELYNKAVHDGLERIDNEDVERWIEAFKAAVEEAGGEIIRASGNSKGGSETDVRTLKPAMPVDTIIEALGHIPNNSEHFLHRDDFVNCLAKVRAALGKASLDPGVEQQVREWATDDPTWCSDEYFDKVWRSLDRVRVGQDALDRFLRQNGIKFQAKHDFDDKGQQLSSGIKKAQAAVRTARGELIERLTGTFIFGDVNTRSEISKIMMRFAWSPEDEFPAFEWFKGESTRSDMELLREIHEDDRFPDNKAGFYNLMRELRKFPSIWYQGEIRHPLKRRGELVAEINPDESVTRRVNLRYLSPTIYEASKNGHLYVKEDVDSILQFMRALFGRELAEYELDTLAYMAQTGHRPGHMLVLVGDHGVGKSLYIQMLASVFDGLTQTARIDGAKLMNENARRFVLADVEGCRIISIKELPSSSNSKTMAELTSMFKQMVDPGSDGDQILIERKGENSRMIENHGRVLISTNYRDAVHIEAQDRRIFYVLCQITQDNKPDEKYYGEISAIMKDPVRLGSIWRYLLKRDIKGYSINKAPPVSSAKAENIVANVANPIERHLRAAIAYLEASDRQAFWPSELVSIMSAMSENEFENSNGAIDERKRYDVKSPAIMGSLRLLKRMCYRVEPKRTATNRPNPIWVFKKFEALAADLANMHRDDSTAFMEQEEDRGLIHDHPWEAWRGLKYID